MTRFAHTRTLYHAICKDWNSNQVIEMILRPLGLGHYGAKFEDQNMCGRLLTSITVKELAELGITKVGDKYVVGKIRRALSDNIRASTTPLRWQWQWQCMRQRCACVLEFKGPVTPIGTVLQFCFLKNPLSPAPLPIGWALLFKARLYECNGPLAQKRAGCGHACDHNGVY